MARPLRLDYPETFYHVLSRGNEKREIFYGDLDYVQFLTILGRMVERFGLEVHARVHGPESGRPPSSKTPGI